MYMLWGTVSWQYDNEDTKEVIIRSKTKKERQYKGQKGTKGQTANYKT
jgi:hypothetical protein